MKQDDIDLEIEYAESQLNNLNYKRLQNNGSYVDSFGNSFDLTTDEKEVLTDYVDDSTKYQITPNKHLDSAISKGFINKDIYVQRYWRKDDFIKLFGKDNYECYVNNEYDLITEKTSIAKNYISCSDGNSSYGSYLCGNNKECVRSIIFVPKGTNLIIFNSAHYRMGYENEGEILLGRNHKLTLVGMDSKQKIILLELD